MTLFGFFLLLNNDEKKSMIKEIILDHDSFTIQKKTLLNDILKYYYNITHVRKQTLPVISNLIDYYYSFSDIIKLNNKLSQCFKILLLNIFDYLQYFVYTDAHDATIEISNKNSESYNQVYKLYKNHCYFYHFYEQTIVFILKFENINKKNETKNVEYYKQQINIFSLIFYDIIFFNISMKHGKKNGNYNKIYNLYKKLTTVSLEENSTVESFEENPINIEILCLYTELSAIQYFDFTNANLKLV